MTSQQHLPTWSSEECTVVAFRDSLIETLRHDQSSTTLSMYFYAVTKSGWSIVRNAILNWMKRDKARTTLLYVGTDHGITDPTALEQIHEDGIEVRFMLKYNGVFHPKLVWLQGNKRHIAWVASNNLTRDGLLNNVEFALQITTSKTPSELEEWSNMVDEASKPLSPELLVSYEKQRREFEKRRAIAQLATFTWKERIDSDSRKSKIELREGSFDCRSHA